MPNFDENLGLLRALEGVKQGRFPLPYLRFYQRFQGSHGFRVQPGRVRAAGVRAERARGVGPQGGAGRLLRRRRREARGELGQGQGHGPEAGGTGEASCSLLIGTNIFENS